jgi:hypothetical protein
MHVCAIKKFNIYRTIISSVTANSTHYKEQAYASVHLQTTRICIDSGDRYIPFSFMERVEKSKLLVFQNQRISFFQSRRLQCVKIASEMWIGYALNLGKKKSKIKTLLD